MTNDKKVPLRKCAGCQQMKEKKELIRIYRNENGQLSIDYTRKSGGRGAYICINSECLKKARKSRGFERSFKKAVPKDIYDTLEKELTNTNE